MVATIRRLWKDESGQGMVEYGLIIGVVAVAGLAALLTLGGGLKGLLESVNSWLTGQASQVGQQASPQ